MKLVFASCQADRRMMTDAHIGFLAAFYSVGLLPVFYPRDRLLFSAAILYRGVQIAT